ncbi:MAG: hypothetical protein IPM29_07205 [Planctomycetes bacterium]|nr:hypothetical protein [Planctomycetota bacterium]
MSTRGGGFPVRCDRLSLPRGIVRSHFSASSRDPSMNPIARLIVQSLAVSVRIACALGCATAFANAQVTLSVDRLDGGDPGAPAPANLVVVDVFADVAATDTWTAAGLRATTANGAVLRYGAGSALVNPGLADRFVTSVSRPLARDADARFNGALAAIAGRYDPTGPTATASAGEVNVAWFSSPPATSTSPSVDGYIARVVIDISRVVGIDPATIVVAPGLPPAGTVPLLVSQPASAGSTVAGTVAATYDVPTVTGIDWCVYANAAVSVVLGVDRLDGRDPGAPAPANLVVVDVFADVAATDTWTAAGLRATTANGAVLRYGAGNALLNPGLADRFVTSVSRPLARNADARFNAALAAIAGRYDPTGPTATATAGEVNVTWFSSPPATSTSPSVDGYIARVVIDISRAIGIDPATIVVAPGLPPAGTVPLLVSQPASAGSTVAGTVAATYDVPAVTGTDWCVYANAVASVVLAVDRLDGADPGAPAPANLVVVDVFADVAPTDTWTAAGLRATTANGAVLRYGAGSALVNPGLADRFVTSVSRPLARDADARFNGALAAIAGRYDPTGPTATASAGEVNVAWFSSPPATSTSPSVDGYIARVVIDISGAIGIDPATIVVAPGLPPAGTVPLLVSQPASAGSTVAGTVAATYDVPAVTGTDWCVYAPSCASYAASSDPTTGTCNALPFGAAASPSLTTVFAQNNGGAIGGAVYFDVTVAAGLYLDGLALNTNVAVGTNLMVDVYRTALGGSYVTSAANPAAWIPETAGFGVAAGVDVPSMIELNSPFLLTPGTYGIAVVARNFNHRYTTGANSYGGANLSIAAGAASNVPFTGILQPRTANVSVGYHTVATAFGNVRYQTIVRRDQLAAGPITGLAFAACATGRHWNDTLEVRMSHVPAGHVLSTTFAANLPAPVTVLSASDHRWHVTGDTWNEIGLQSAFVYDGISDVVVDIVARGNFHTAAAAFHRESNVPRVAAWGWTGSPPSAAIGANTAADNLGTKVRLQRGCADAAEFGWSCGPLRAGHSGLPVLGQTFGFTCSNAPANQPVYLSLGVNNQSPRFPFDLSGIGLVNCTAFHDAITSVSTVANGLGDGVYQLNFPYTPTSVGFLFYGQCIAIDVAATGGVAISNYVRMVVGL